MGTGCGGRGATWTDAIAAPAVADAGTTFAYGPFPFITMGAALERVRHGEWLDIPDQRILKPLGVTVEWRAKCGDGKPQLAGGAAMTARDWATFGEFIRRGGVHDVTKHLLPDSLVQQLFRPSTSNPSSACRGGCAMQPHRIILPADRKVRVPVVSPVVHGAKAAPGVGPGHRTGFPAIWCLQPAPVISACTSSRRRNWSLCVWGPFAPAGPSMMWIFWPHFCSPNVADAWTG